MNFKLNNFLRVLVPFGLTQALGVYAAFKFLPQVIFVEPAGLGSFSLADLIILVAIIVIFFAVAVRFKRVGTAFYRFFLTILIFSGTQAIFGIWFPPLVSTVWAIGLTALFWVFQNILTHNIAMILTIAGIGSVLGLSLLPLTVIYVLVAFSFYDIIAVYKTGHMVKMAQAMIQSRAIFGFIVPEAGQSVRGHVSKVAPGEGFMILGSGDVIFPLLLSASLVRISILAAVIVGVFSVLGLFLMHLIFINQKTRRPMAALPPIALMSIIGYVVASLI